MASLQKPQKKEGLHFVRCFTKRDTKKRALYEDNVMYLVGQAESSIGKSSQTGFIIGGFNSDIYLAQPDRLHAAIMQ